MSKVTIYALACLGIGLAPYAIAQDLQLGQRPIKRTEVSAGARTRFAAMDGNHDGAIEANEFEAYRAKQAKLAGGGAGLYHVGSRWFEKSDTNADGRVTLAEAEARPLQMFDLADANRDGIASIPEQKVALMLKGLGR